MDQRNCPVPSQVTWENNQIPLNEMHMHQQNHWNDPFLLVPSLPLVPMDHQFDESYLFVYIGHVWLPLIQWIALTPFEQPGPGARSGK